MVGDITYKELHNVHADIAKIVDGREREEGVKRQLQLLDIAMECQRIAMNEGLLALEDYTYKMCEMQPRMSLHMMLAIDGKDPQLIEDTAFYKAESLQFHRYDALIYWLEVLCVLKIQEGVNANELEQSITEMFTSDAEKEYRKRNDR